MGLASFNRARRQQAEKAKEAEPNKETIIDKIVESAKKKPKKKLDK